MKNIAIITARGGSKRIPKKNIKDFCGKPVMAYSIEAAIKSKLFDEVMVSTDDEEIKNVAIQYGALVPFMRSEETSNDFATTADVINEVLLRYQKLGKKFDTITCIYPTAIFVTGERLVEAIKLLTSADAVLSVVRYSFPPQRAFVVREGKVAFQYPEYAKSRSQDLEPIYHDCGQFYICKTDAFFKYQTMVPPETVPYIMSEEEVQDIDTISDWKIAELKYQAFHKGE